MRGSSAAVGPFEPIGSTDGVRVPDGGGSPLDRLFKAPESKPFREAA